MHVSQIGGRGSLDQVVHQLRRLDAVDEARPAEVVRHLKVDMWTAIKCVCGVWEMIVKYVCRKMALIACMSAPASTRALMISRWLGGDSELGVRLGVRLGEAGGTTENTIVLSVPLCYHLKDDPK
jgi:hypothetical protein